MIRHGLSKVHPLYATWKTMRQRCLNPKCKKFKNYGARGIKVCEAWNDFAQYLKDIGERPSIKHTIDRIDNNGNYEPGNIRWALSTVQCLAWRNYIGICLVRTSRERMTPFAT